MSRHRHRSLLGVAIAGALVVPAIGASWPAAAQVTIPTMPSTTTTTEPETTTTTAAETTTTTDGSGTTTTTDGSATTTTTAAATTTTVAPSAGVLSISAPSAAQLSAGTPISAGTLAASLGSVTVTDDRGAVGATWIATVTTTHFVTGGGSAAETIERANVAYWSGPVVDAGGIGLFTPGQPTAAEAQALDVPRTAFSMSSGIGDNAVTWTPTLIVTIPPTAVTGEYTGTITHSVA
jgi:hypothetical protein